MRSGIGGILGMKEVGTILKGVKEKGFFCLNFISRSIDSTFFSIVAILKLLFCGCLFWLFCVVSFMRSRASMVLFFVSFCCGYTLYFDLFVQKLKMENFTTDSSSCVFFFCFLRSFLLLCCGKSFSLLPLGWLVWACVMFHTCVLCFTASPPSLLFFSLSGGYAIFPHNLWKMKYKMRTDKKRREMPLLQFHTIYALILTLTLSSFNIALFQTELPSTFRS